MDSELALRVAAYAEAEASRPGLSTSEVATIRDQANARMPAGYHLEVLQVSGPDSYVPHRFVLVRTVLGQAPVPDGGPPPWSREMAHH